MKIQKKLAAAFAALFILLSGFPASAPDIHALQKKNDITAADGAPAFCAKIEYSFQGYIVKGTFTEFTPDTSSVQPLYSLDGKNYQVCGENWDLSQLGTEDEDVLAKLQNQICLYSNYEPLKSYLAEKLDYFYMKLRITRNNGIIYDTQPSVIDRGAPQPVPEGLTPGAQFSPAMAVIEKTPFNYYGKYQLTISENTTAEEILAYLPDTLPVKIDLAAGINHFTDGIVNCPVKWKPLALPRLTAGESVTIADAAEEIVVPEGTLVTTPMGIFQLDEPLSMPPYAPADEVRLVLNVISEDENPTGVLSEENDGLEVSFHHKPTGATAIRAYTFSEGDSEWTEIPDLSLVEAVNAQPSTKNSGYTLVLHNTLKPYQTYLEAQNAGDKPTPFFVGLKIEGGVYNGKQLILSWPDTYESPAKLPDIGGSGGNHNNAGASSKDDSTESGQRPDLPHTPEDEPQATAGTEDTESDNSGEFNNSVESNNYGEFGNSKEDNNTNSTENNTESSNKKDVTVNAQHLNRPQITATPNDIKNKQLQNSAVNTKTGSSAKLTAPAPLQPDTKIPDSLADRGETSKRATESKHHGPLLAVAVLAAIGLCIAGIYMFRRFLLRRK